MSRIAFICAFPVSPIHMDTTSNANNDSKDASAASYAPVNPDGPVIPDDHDHMA